ncbi:MAG: class I SAM-dependent methyltransferase [Bacteroidota bacterium]
MKRIRALTVLRSGGRALTYGWAGAALMLLAACAWWGQDRSHLLALFVAACGAMVCVGVLILRDGLSRRQVLLGAVGARVLYLPLLPGLSDDAYRYVWDGWVQAAGFNPYAFRPVDAELALFQGEPLFELLNSATYYSVYPPSSQLVFWLGALARPWGWEASYYLIKLVFVAVEVSAIWALSTLVQARHLLLYAWNPVALLEIAGQAHTEALMVGGLVWMVWAVRQDRPGPAAAAISVAVWAKLTPAVLGPVVLGHTRWRPFVVVGLLVSGGLIAPYAAPYVMGHVRESLSLYVSLFEFNAGLYLAIKEVLRWATGDDWSKWLGPRMQVTYLMMVPLIWLVGWMWRWSLARTSLLLLGLFLITATTVHPWYLLGLLALVPLRPQTAWPWVWVALVSLGTYQHYVDGAYAIYVVLAWGGGALLVAPRLSQALLQAGQRLRGGRKGRHLRALLPPLAGQRVLDLGAGEGYVGEALARYGAHVLLADVLDMNRTRLPHLRLPGDGLPFPDRSFEVVVLYFVLHHTEDPEAVLAEARRVCSGQVVVVESVYTTETERRWLTRVDQWVNRLRSAGSMREQEEHLTFHQAAVWEAKAEQLGLRVTRRVHQGAFFHRPFTMVLEADPEGTRSGV